METISQIKQINLEIDGSCNIKCQFCPQSTGREASFLKKMPLPVFYKIIEEAIPLGLTHVNLSGSGEPLLNKELEKAVRFLSQNNIITMIYTNGVALTPKRFESLCEAGLTFIKVSCMGWDKESYAHWMAIDAFDRVRKNLENCLSIIEKKGYPSKLQTNHLIQNNNELEHQKEMYLKNWINHLGVHGEIWMTHNWSGLYNDENVSRHDIFKDRKLRSCGRPLANVVEIRAGGLDGKVGAVVPCSLVLGKDSVAVMGHCEDTPLIDILNGDKMKHLRDVHIREAFHEIDYCANCDQLLDAEETLVWTNIPGRNYGNSSISNLEYVGAEKNWTD
jgi:MoaA/NifB/PqqE/SkfB family radical SAM enzyme